MLGKRLERARQARGMTQEQLATASGIKQSHISRLENDDIKDIKGVTLRRLARALRVTTDELLGMHEEEEVEFLAAAVA
jgi:transcriptional regulator with XRE-family HTH domain